MIVSGPGSCLVADFLFAAVLGSNPQDGSFVFRVRRWRQRFTVPHFVLGTFAVFWRSAVNRMYLITIGKL